MQSLPRCIVPLLNGVDHVEVLRAHFGRDRVLPATIAVEAEKIAPGRFVQRSPFVNLNLAASAKPAVDGFAVGNVEGRFALIMAQHGLLRPLGTAELSGGTLRYLLWIAALLTPRPPALMVLNEPETSLHPDLLCALARLIARASERTQVVVVTHAKPLISAFAEQAGCHSIVLEKTFGETKISGFKELRAPVWHWPSR